MPLMIRRILATPDWRRALNFHRALGFRCTEPNGGEANALWIHQRNGWWDTTHIAAAPAEPAEGVATVYVRFADAAQASALFDRAITAGARPVGELRYQDLDGHTWVLEY